MDPSVFLAAMASAVLHAAWNAAARRRSDPGQGLAVVLYASSLVSVPLLIVTGLPARDAWPWLLCGLAANLVSARALMGAYRRAPFTVSYPITRGLTPPLVAVAAGIDDRAVADADAENEPSRAGLDQGPARGLHGRHLPVVFRLTRRSVFRTAVALHPPSGLVRTEYDTAGARPPRGRPLRRGPAR